MPKNYHAKFIGLLTLILVATLTFIGSHISSGGTTNNDTGTQIKNNNEATTWFDSVSIPQPETNTFTTTTGTSAATGTNSTSTSNGISTTDADDEEKNLIDDLVKSGKLTEDEAKELVTKVMMNNGTIKNASFVTVPTTIENQTAPNLVSNPDFSIVDNNQSGLPLNWSDSSNICGRIYACEINGTDGWGDRQSFQLSTTNNTNNTWSSIKGNEIDVKPGENYELVSHMKLNDWATQSHVVLEGYNETSKRWYQISQCPSGLYGYRENSEWLEFACHRIIPENTTKIRPELNAGWSSNLNNEATTLFDSVSIIKKASLVSNPDFSIVGNNQSGLPLDWSDSSNMCGGTYTCKINGTDGWGDRQSFQLSTTNNTNNTWSSIKGNEIDVKPGENYELVSHMKLNDWATQSHVVLEGYNETSQQWYQLMQCPDGTNGPLEWQEFACPRIIPENTTKIRPELNAGWSSEPNNEATTLFDSVSIIKNASLVSNPDFSIVGNNQSGLPLDWSDSSNMCGGTYTCKINGTDGWGDRQSFQLSTTNNTNNTWLSIKGNEIDVKPGENFELVSHMKLNDWATQSHVVLEGYNETSQQWYQLMQCPDGTNGPLEWQEFACPRIIPENTTKIRPELNAGWSSEPNNEATTLFDSVSIIKNASLVSNPDFSIVGNNQSGLPLDWSDSSNMCGGTYTCKINGTDGWGDRQSFQLSTTNNTNNTWSSIKGNEIDVKPGENYELVSHMKLNDWATQSHVVLEGYNETSQQWYQLMQCPDGTNGPLEWQEFACPRIIPENTTKIRPELNAGWSSEPNNEATTLFDSVSIIKNASLVSNPDFSIVGNNQSGLPLDWSDSSNMCGGTYTCKINGTDGWGDRQSFQLSTTNNTNNTWSSIKGNEIDVKPGENYELVSHMKLNDWATQSHVVLEGYNETSQQWYQLMQCPDGTNGPLEWQEFACPRIIPENTTKIRPELNAGWSSEPNNEATTLFDSVSIIKNASFVTVPTTIENQTAPNLVFVTVPTTIENQTAPNLVSNPDFSIVGNNQSGLPLDWSDSSNICGRTYTCKINGTDGGGDKESFQLSTTNNTNNTWSSIKGNEIDVKPGENYELVSHMKLNDWATQSHVVLEGYNETSKGWYQISQCPSGLYGYRENWEWRKFSCFMTIPGNTTEIRPVLNAGWSSEPNNEATTLFDSVSIIKKAFVTDPNLEVEVVSSELDFPTGMAFLSPNDILVLEKDKGTVERIVNGVKLSEPLLDLDVGENGGLLAIAIGKNMTMGHNGNTESTYVFLYTAAEKTHENHIQSKVSSHNHLYRYEFVNNSLVNPKLLLDLPAGYRHNGAKILIGHDKYLYIIVGELWNETGTNFRNHALNYLGEDGNKPDGRGGILKIDQNGQAISIHGILGDEEPLNKYYAYGIRNGFGMDFDPLSGKLWDTENGPEWGDEINLVEPGFNSGWGKVQGIWTVFNVQDEKKGDLASEKPGNLVDFDGRGKYSSPEFTWNQRVGPTDLKFLATDKLGRQYENDMLVADVNNHRIYHFELNQNRTALVFQGSLTDKVSDNYEELDNVTFAMGFDGIITDMEIGPDGYLYVVAEQIYRIAPIDQKDNI